MLYYKVKPEYDQYRVRGQQGEVILTLVADELYTPSERQTIGNIPDDAVTPVTIPNHRIYWFFGARFATSDREGGSQ